MTNPTDPQPDVDLSTLSRVELETRLQAALNQLRSLEEQGILKSSGFPKRFHTTTLMSVSGCGSDGVLRATEVAYGYTEGSNFASNLITIRSRWPNEQEDRRTQIALSSLGFAQLRSVLVAPVFPADPEPQEVLVSSLKHLPRDGDGNYHGQKN